MVGNYYHVYVYTMWAALSIMYLPALDMRSLDLISLFTAWPTCTTAKNFAA